MDPTITTHKGELQRSDKLETFRQPDVWSDHIVTAPAHVPLEPPAPAEAPRRAAAAGRRASLETDEFRLAVVEHLIHTCAKDVREASPHDLYQAFAHTVRDRLVHRWLATQRTHVERDVKRVCYLSSEFLTGRSLGLCLMNMGLYEAAETLAADRGFELGQILEREGDPGLGNGGLGRLAACFMDSLATLALPAIGYGIRYDFGMFEQKIDGGRQIEQHDNWLQLGNAWELPRHEDAQTVRFGGRVEFHRDMDGALRATWVDARAVVGLPYDSFIVGHRTDTANTLRLGLVPQPRPDRRLRVLGDCPAVNYCKDGRLKQKNRGESEFKHRGTGCC